MASITISEIQFASPPGGDVEVKFTYKHDSDPQIFEILPTGIVLVNSSGILVAPIVISGLDPNTDYVIIAQPQKCISEPLEVLVTTPTDSCPTITGIGYTSVNY